MEQFSLQGYKKINSKFFLQPTHSVCEKLIGAIIVCNTKNGKIVAKISKLEGYLGVNDKACHTFNNKKTNRTKTMYETGGTLYVYFVYGMHYNINFVTENVGIPTAILLRGVQVLSGLDIAAKNRYNKNANDLTKIEIKNLSNGPGKVAKIFEITKEHNGKNFSELFEIYINENKNDYLTTSRIGIDYAGDDKLLPYRYVLI